jgi:hypothetical protein
MRGGHPPGQHPENVSPKTQVQRANLGHPPPYYTFAEKYRSDILSTISVPGNMVFRLRSTRSRAGC